MLLCPARAYQVVSKSVLKSIQAKTVRMVSLPAKRKTKMTLCGEACRLSWNLPRE